MLRRLKPKLTKPEFTELIGFADQLSAAYVFNLVFAFNCFYTCFAGFLERKSLGLLLQSENRVSAINNTKTTSEIDL